jgi:hypothetical protein
MDRTTLIHFVSTIAAFGIIASAWVSMGHLNVRILASKRVMPVLMPNFFGASVIGTKRIPVQGHIVQETNIITEKTYGDGTCGDAMSRDSL